MGHLCACVSMEAGKEIRKSGYIFCGELVQEASNFGRVKKPLNNNNNILTKNIPKRQKKKGEGKKFFVFCFFLSQNFSFGTPRRTRRQAPFVSYFLFLLFLRFLFAKATVVLSLPLSVLGLGGVGRREGLLAEFGCAVVGFGQQPVSYKWIFSSSHFFRGEK